MKKLLSVLVLGLLFAQTAGAQLVYVPFRSIQKETRGMAAPQGAFVKTSITGPGNDIVVKGSNLRRAHVEMILDPFTILAIQVPAAQITNAQLDRLIGGLAKLDKDAKGPLAAEHWDVIVDVLMCESEKETKALVDRDPTTASLDPIIDRMLVRAAELAKTARLLIEMRGS
ncbi:MAG: hypothetical protein WC969_05195 [Elusimicrobiota bacterium]|jgi:hypothetical protein